MNKSKKSAVTGLYEPIETAVWFRLYSLGMSLCNDPRVAVILGRDRKSYVRRTVDDIAEIVEALPSKPGVANWALSAVQAGVRQYKADEKRRAGNRGQG